MDVKEVIFSDFVSKNGNPCKVIEYHSTYFFELPIKEYFVESQTFAMKRFELRKAKVSSGRVSQIVYNYDGKYPRIQRLVISPREND